MRFFILSSLVIGLTACRSPGDNKADQTGQTDEAGAIIASFPDIDDIWRIASTAHDTSLSVEQTKTEQNTIESYRASFRRLHALIKPGDMISDFPGILALGETRWREKQKAYELHCGVFDVPTSTPPWYSRAWIRFDVSGKILEVVPHGENW
jgi:hypothetical protein